MGIHVGRKREAEAEGDGRRISGRAHGRIDVGGGRGRWTGMRGRSRNG